MKVKSLSLYIAIFISLAKATVIDVDLPKWSIGYYQPIDELYYTGLAYNLFESKNLFAETSAQLFGWPTITNAATYICLLLFGDNYSGLRFASILFSVTSVVLFFYVLKGITKDKFVIWTLPIFFAMNFNFSLASIVAEPTICRTAIMMLTMCLTINLCKRHFEKPLWLFFYGIIFLWLTIFTYLTNAFTLLGISLSLILVCKKHYHTLIQFGKNAFKANFFVGLGIIVGFLLYLFFAQLVGLNDLDSLSGMMGNFSYRIGDSHVRILLNIVNIVRANLFVFNPGLLVLFVCGLIFAWKNKPENWSIELISCYSFTIAMLVQTIFVNDFPQRKLVILLPLVLLLVANLVDYDFNKDGQKNKKRILLNFGLIVSLFSMTFIYFKLLANDYKHLLMSPGFIALYVVLGLMIVMAFTPYKKALYVLIFTVLLTPELIMDINFIRNRSYHYRDALIKLKKYDGKEFIGGYSMGFRPYNMIKASLNCYSYYYNDRDSFWKKTGYLAKVNSDRTYSVGYLSDKKKFEEIGFYPTETLIKAGESVDEEDIVVYEEE